ncbi:MAG: response regulator transcription factor [Firmicutes bacterium]|nr:response regulator transcription factor [Bacillota bacterium]
MARVLVVDDEEAIRELVAYTLEREGFEADAVADGRAALERLERQPYDLVLLDRMLPGMQGTDVLRRIRAQGRLPVILLTAKAGENDRVEGLEAGADDYVGKPFSPRELVARVRAVLRRAGGGQGAAVLRVGDLELDLKGHGASVRGRPVRLTATEFALLRHLAEHAGRTLSREDLIRGVWGYDFEGDARTIDVHVRHLREKIEDDPARPRRIETVRGVGYRLRREGRA